LPWQWLFLCLLFLSIHLIHSKKQKLVSLFHPLSLNAPYRNGKAEEEHGSDNGENEGKMWKVGSGSEIVACEWRRRADPAEIEEIPKP